MYGVFVDGTLAAKLGLLRMRAYVNGSSMKMGGIVSVATWPEYRRGGRVAGLLRHALQVMKDEESFISHLAPFAFAFYRRYGWEYTIDRKHYTVERADWPSWQTEGRVSRVADWQSVAPLYDVYAKRYAGMLDRNDEWWQKQVIKSKPGTIALYRNADGVPTGYLIYTVKGGEMTVYEMVHLDEDARRGLWCYIGNHDSMASKATFVVPVDDGLPFLLPNPRIKQEIVPYFMTRIVDVEPFLRQYEFLPGEALRLSIQVNDPDAHWNNTMFHLNLARDGGMPSMVMRGRGMVDDGDSDGAIRCDIQTLTAMLFGYRRPLELFAMGRLEGRDSTVQAWEERVPRQTTFLYDFF